MGEGRIYDYGMRMYDAEGPHFWSVDPLASKYPYYSPYTFAGGNPIRYIDLDGAEPAEPGKNVGDVQSGTNGQGPARSWRWNGKKWEDNSALSEVVFTAKRKQKTYDQIAKQHPQVPFAISGAYSTALSLYTGSYNTYGSVNSSVMANLTETQKQQDFKTNAAKTNGILIWEFLTGTGEENRSFDESNPITDEIKWSESSRLAAWYAADLFNSGKFQDGQTIPFYAGMAPGEGGIGKLESLRRHLNAYMTTPSSFYRGGMQYSMTRRGNDLMVKVTDAYTVMSMIRVNETIHRIPGRVTPLGKTTVSFNFIYKDAFKR